MTQLDASSLGPQCLRLHLLLSFMPDALPAATLLIYHGLGQALSCAGFHALWLVFCGIIT